MAYNFYKRTPKTQKELRTLIYEETILENLLSMFDYDGLPDTVDTLFLERELCVNGICAITNIFSNEWISCRCTFGGGLDLNGNAVDLILTTGNGKQKTITDWKKSDRVAVFFNNNLRVPDRNIERFSAMLGEIDLSMYYNVLYSRYAPIMVCETEADKKKLEKAFSNLTDGNPLIISSSSVNMITGQDTTPRAINYTDVKNSDKLQYLSHFHTDIIRRLYTLYGISITGNNKMAQESVAEVNGTAVQGLIVPFDRLKARRGRFVWEGLQKFNAISGCSATVDFSECLLMQIAKNGIESDGYEESAEEQEIDAIRKEMTEETAEETEESEGAENG